MRVLRPLAGLVVLGSCAELEPLPLGRIVTFGDSNTDWGLRDSVIVSRSYISRDLPRAEGPAGPFSLAAKLSERGVTLAVNHGIVATSTDTSYDQGVPNARTMVNGLTRFEAEVLGRGYPWSANETYGPLVRVHAFIPTQRDFVYVAMGTNDPALGIGPGATSANVRWMVETWLGEGLPASHFLLATLPPRWGLAPGIIPQLNDSLRAIAARFQIQLIELADQVSGDNGATWRSPIYHIGDGIHYREAVRDWIASTVVAIMKRTP